MPLYCAVFLSFEILPLVLERVYYTGNERSRAFLNRIAPMIRKAYPFVIIGAYVIPLMHQSSLGGLLLLAGTKINPLWQSPMMPLLYLIAAVFCGLGFTIFLLMIICLRYARKLDAAVLAELANLLSGVCFVFLAVRIADLIWRQQLRAAFAFDKMSMLFLFESAMILAPALALRFRRIRETPRALLNMSALACLGGMLYRFIPTSIAYTPLRSTAYFPSAPELVMAAGYIALGCVAFVLAVNYFAVLPGEASTWDHTFRPFGWPRQSAQSSIAMPITSTVVRERAI
jgi:Ni/Fe-hydrogenase subunit HybB-like protein